MSQHCCNRIFRGEAWACFLLRMWIGMRLMFAGLTKWKGTNEEGAIVFDPKNSEKIQEAIVSQMSANTPLTSDMVKTYATMLPWALTIVGCWVIVGLFSRLSLIASGALILSLSFGLMLMPEDIEATFRAIEILVIALALITVKHNILAVDNLIEIAMGGNGDDDESSERRKKD